MLFLYVSVAFLDIKVSIEGKTYALVFTTNLKILIVICCTHLHIHHMSRIQFLLLSFLDFVVYVVMTLIFPTNQRKCASSWKNVAIPLLLFKRAITAPNKLIDSTNVTERKDSILTITRLNPSFLKTLNYFKMKKKKNLY